MIAYPNDFHLSYNKNVRSAKLVNEHTIEQITPIPWKSQLGYYTWFLTAINDTLYYSHEGGDTGVKTIVVIDVINKNGIVIFANASHKLGNLLRGIESVMWGK